VQVLLACVSPNVNVRASMHTLSMGFGKASKRKVRMIEVSQQFMYRFRYPDLLQIKVSIFTWFSVFMCKVREGTLLSSLLSLYLTKQLRHLEIAVPENAYRDQVNM